MSYWNHRIVQHKDGPDDEAYFEIVECMYNDDGTISSYTDGIAVGGNSLAELLETLEQMRQCVEGNKPILVDGEVEFVDQPTDTE